MNIHQILSEYDALFSDHTIEEIEAFLLKHIESARSIGNDAVQLSLYNELMGLCRETGNTSLGLDCIEKIEALCLTLQLQGEVYGTTLLNLANASRVFGLHEKAHLLYPRVEALYKESLSPDSFSFASLYNNWSLLCQEDRDYDGAIAFLRKALDISALYPEASLKTATSQINLANILLQLPAASSHYGEVFDLLHDALAAFEADGGRNYHYSAALAAMGNALYQTGRFKESADYYNRAMKELESHIGKTGAWEQLSMNYQEALRHI